MKTHVSSKYHVHNELSEFLEVVSGEVSEDVALGEVPHDAEGVGHVVVLKHRLVIVQQSQLRSIQHNNSTIRVEFFLV